MNPLYPLKYLTINKFSYRLVLCLFCLGVLSVLSCNNDETKTEAAPILQKVSFSASNASNKEGIKFSAYPTVKLLITTDKKGKTPTDYYEGKQKKTFKAGGTEIPIKEGAVLIDLESESGEGKTYYIQQFDLDATNKTSYRLARVASFKLTYKGSLKSVPLALVENKVMVESEKTSETKPATHSGKSKSKSSETTRGKSTSSSSPEAAVVAETFFFYVQFQKKLSEQGAVYYKGTDKDISGITFKVTDENGNTHHTTRDFFGDIKGDKTAEKFKIILPAQASIYKNKTLTITEASASIGAEGTKKTQRFTFRYYDDSGGNVPSIKKGGEVIFIPPGEERWITIKDKNFLNYLKKTIPGAFNEKDEMDRISPLVKNLKKIILFFKQIKTLDEIKYFTGLTELSCSHTPIANLDLSQNTNLIKLDCSHTPLTNLNLSQNASLIKLDCSYTQLTSLQLENNTQLTELSCSHSPLANLNLSQNTNLMKLSCSYTQLTSLQLENDTQLSELYCSHTPLANLNLSRNTNLMKLSCSYNDQLTALYLENNTQLTGLDCSYNNQLTTLHLKNNTKLTKLKCFHNQLTDIQLQNDRQLTELDCSYNQLTNLDLSQNTNLTHLNCNNNKLNNPNLNQNTKLTHLQCNNNQISNPYFLQNNRELIELYCYNNPSLRSLMLTHNCKLTKENVHVDTGLNVRMCKP